MTCDTIQIFACDHRQDVEWNLPFIRVSHSNELINLSSDSFLNEHKDLMSEPAKMLFIHKHINEFGNPSYEGFCHYRRYFARCTGHLQHKIVVEDFNHILSNCILSPIEQLLLIKKFNVDGILEFPFLDVVDAMKYATVVDMFNHHINVMPNINSQNSCPLNIPSEVVDHWLKMFLEHLPLDLKMYFDKALTYKNVYHSNIFTMKREICDLYFSMLQILTIDIINFIDNSKISIMNTRWLSYMIEYLFSNIFFRILSISGKYKFMHCQLLVQ